MKLRLLGAVCACVVATITNSASAEFLVLDHSISVNTQSSEVTFTVLFNKAPDFYTVAPAGQQANVHILADSDH